MGRLPTLPGPAFDIPIDCTSCKLLIYIQLYINFSIFGPEKARVAYS